jgi:ABC-type multidrug transport system ATPase subunit
MTTYESELGQLSFRNYDTRISNSILFSKAGDLVDNNSGVRLDVRDVSYSVMVSGKEKCLLRNINMRVEPGEVCALMGSSGAGKR